MKHDIFSMLFEISKTMFRLFILSLFLSCGLCKYIQYFRISTCDDDFCEILLIFREICLKYLGNKNKFEVSNRGRIRHI